ncbi:MAG: glutamate--tRNA ligase [Deltaproteobacteria bacterium]|nr:glutamate--tRNA ligase [Deltaproteobacteria bacterium]
MQPVRTRFAPSPTGFLHIGGARTALFNWAFARRNGGCFVLRIEDTDRERSTTESEAAVIDGLRWLEIDWDEGPLRQSERAARHREAIEALLAKGRAYRCICTREELETRKQASIAAGCKWTYDGRCRDAGHGPDRGPHTVRLRLDLDTELAWHDLVYGPSGQAAREIGDMIIRRSDGGPLYNLAVVVDDVDMAITHVIRGADHHSNTPLQLAIYRALDATPPLFAHVPLIVGGDGKKLSKRRDPVSVQQFRAEGHPVDAMRNWLVRIGWSHGDQEIFTRDEIASLFDLDAVHRASARADTAKLAFLSQHFLKTLPRETLFAELEPFLDSAAGHPVARSAALERLVDLLRERSHTLVEMASLARFFLVENLAYDEKAAQKHLRREIEPALAALHDRLAALGEWSAAGIEEAFEAVRAAHDDLPLGKLAQPVRVAITGGAVSPPIFDTLEVLGQPRSLGRIAEALHFIRHG